MWSSYSAEKMSLICKKVFQGASIHAEMMHFVPENNKMVPACYIQCRQQGGRAGRRRCRQGFYICSLALSSPPLLSLPALLSSLFTALSSCSPFPPFSLVMVWWGKTKRRLSVHEPSRCSGRCVNMGWSHSWGNRGFTGWSGKTVEEELLSKVLKDQKVLTE